MASNRHLGRIVALQTLYEYEFRIQSGDTDVTLDEILDRNIQRYQETIDDIEFIRTITVGTNSRIEELDAIIQPVAPEWPVSQIARVDRAILRLSVYELHFGTDVPPKVVINEAVELGKAFGGENSSKFINGVLGTVYRDLTSIKETSKPSSAIKKPKTTKKTSPKSKDS